MAEAMRAVGIGHFVRHGDKEYELTPFNWEHAALFERWAEGRVWAMLERSKAYCDAEEYDKRLKATIELLASDQFKYGSVACGQLALTPAGRKQLLYLQLKDKNPEVTEELVEKMWRDDWETIAAKIRAAEHDPNSAPPPSEAATAGETTAELPTSSPSSPASHSTEPSTKSRS